LPDVTPPCQIDNGPMGTTTHIPFFERMLGPTWTIERVGPALTLRYAGRTDTDATAHRLRRLQRSRNHLPPRAWPGTGYDRPAIV
jgi:hypothetical protein